MPLMIGEFLVMAGSFFVVFFILATCIRVGDDGGRTERAISRRWREREKVRKERLNRYR